MPIFNKHTMSSTAEFFGSLPYSAFNSPAAGVAISPFSQVNFAYFHLENFDDGVLNTPGVNVREFATTNISTAFSDSVDGDDGVIDGQATGNTRSLFSNFSTSSFTFDFSANALGGRLPTHAGIVWTDIGRNGGGTPLSSDLINNTVFEAFGPSGELLGVIGPFSLGDTSISRTTLEDRFFGVTNSDGISSIRLSMPGKNNWEVDHLQYGSVSLEPTPAPGLNGDDRLIGTPRRDTIRGFDGNDTILGLGNKDRLLGDAGNDTLIGGAGNDTLIGGAGNDRLDGEAGNDVLTTSAGRDVIVLRRAQGFDRVTDFKNNQDKIDLVGISFGQLTLRQQQNDVLVKLGQSNLLLIENTNLRSINRKDFV